MTTTYPISLRVKMIRETEEFLEENLPGKGVVEAGEGREHDCGEEMKERKGPGRELDGLEPAA